VSVHALIIVAFALYAKPRARWGTPIIILPNGYRRSMSEHKLTLFCTLLRFDESKFALCFENPADPALGSHWYQWYNRIRAKEEAMILITGATSCVGRVVVSQLAAEGRGVRCLLRPSLREQRLSTGIPFSSVSASMSDLPALRTAMQGVTAIVHLTGEEDLDYGETLRNHVEDTSNLLPAAQEADVRRFIYLSRLGADRVSAYPLFRARGDAEALLRESGLDYTILQVSVTYGPEDVFTNVLVMLAKMMPLI